MDNREFDLAVPETSTGKQDGPEEEEEDIPEVSFLTVGWVICRLGNVVVKNLLANFMPLWSYSL